MPKISKTYRIDSEVLVMLHKLIELQEETLSIKFNQTSFIEYLIRDQYYSLGLPQVLKDSEGNSEGDSE